MFQVTYNFSPSLSTTAKILNDGFLMEHFARCYGSSITSLKTYFLHRPEQPVSSDLPLHLRKESGGPGDFKIIDENGREVWASEWCRAAYNETKPQPVLRRRGKR